MNWFVRTAEGDFGPLPYETIAAWAREARILASDLVCPEAEGAEWAEAGAWAELGLIWRIQFPDGAASQPVHADTIAAAVRSGEFQADWVAVDGRDGLAYRVGDVACAALYAQVDRLREDLDAASPSPPGTPETPPEEPASPSEWQRVIREFDAAKRDAVKYRKFFEDEQARSQAREENLAQVLEQYRANERNFEERIRLLNQTRDRLENEVRELRVGIRSAAPGQEVISLQELLISNQEMARELARMQEQLLEHDRQLEQARRERDEAETDARERARKLEEALARERQETQRSREQMIRLEHKHRETLSAYRELSDRLILMRNESLQRGARGEIAGEGGQEPPAPPRADGPRIRLR